MFCEIPNSRHNSLVNLALNLGSRSLMMRDSNPNQLNMCLRYNWAVPSAVISSLQGMKTEALVQSWSVMVRRESYPWDLGSLVIKSSAIVSNGSASGHG